MIRSKYVLFCLASGGFLLQAGCITDLITFVAPLILWRAGPVANAPTPGTFPSQP